MLPLIGIVIVAACSAAPMPRPQPQDPVQRLVPKAATIEPSGFATIERAPPIPYPDEPPPAEGRPTSEAGWYAREVGVSEQEAARRQREQQAIRPEFERLLGALRKHEAGNFTAPRMIHKPDWAYVLYFRRDPERTLAKYTSNPRFQAGLAPYTRAELEALIRPWTERFTRHRLTGGWGVDDTYGRAEIMMNVTEEEYRQIAAREGWGQVPDAIELKFASPLTHPPLEEAARPYVRIFPQSDRSTVIQLTAASGGRIVLRDGCLFVQGRGGRAQLAYFHRETGLGIDEGGYLALKDRMTGRSKGRIGEWFTWAGPNEIREDMPMVADLRARCGTAQIINVGNPESTYQSRVRAWEIDDLARRRRISRQRAWEMLKQCWARNDAAQPDASPSGECNL
jgi:hypothetical protein